MDLHWRVIFQHLSYGDYNLCRFSSFLYHCNLKRAPAHTLCVLIGVAEENVDLLIH